MAPLFAIGACAAHAQSTPPASQTQVRDYRPIFRECREAGGGRRLAIRQMKIDGNDMLLTVDPTTLWTHLEHAQVWSCSDTDDEHEKDTRYVAAVRSSCTPLAGGAALPSDIIADGGLTRGAETGGSFITGDLCPSRRPLDRTFLDRLQAVESPLPVALSISGTWLTRHRADFQWLRDRERAGKLQITWVDHSYDHPYIPGRSAADNFLLTPGVDIKAEILDTERLLIANGETPSVFFRFPGLISNLGLMQVMRDDHLIVLGADAWLARSPRARAGDIILLHLNGNEPAGIAIFSDLLARGKLPQPFRPITEAP